jgi:hypothetical protein
MRLCKQFIFLMAWLFMVTCSLMACGGGGGADAPSSGVKLNVVWSNAAPGVMSIPADVGSIMLKVKGADMATIVQSLPVNETSVALTVPDGADRTFIVWAYPIAMGAPVNYYGVTTASVSGNTAVTIFMETGVPQPFPESADSQSPTMPTGLAATAVSYDQVNLSWNASTDNVGVSGYRIFRNGSLVASSVTAPSFSDTGLTGNAAYNYQVAAYDAVGNLSQWSAPPVSVMTPPAPPRTVNGTVMFGTIGLDMVRLTLTPVPIPISVFTNFEGRYQFPNIPPGTYTITPEKSNFVFVPSSRSITVSGADVTGQDFQASTP